MSQRVCQVLFEAVLVLAFALVRDRLAIMRHQSRPGEAEGVIMSLLVHLVQGRS